MALFHQIKRVANPEDDLLRQQQRISDHIRKSGAEALLGKRGRKPDPNAKQLLTLRLDPQVIEYFRSTGEGWQTRMNEALRKAAGL
ncbi:hypothetical protein CO670_15455 [Rhizobium sp. J15]|uniref:BrnA antitoxin family protein n=1 Tax=Rhizobium sp. J15 TaxID=2035450 RepID=UPI000BE92B62|nr:BrnA antitoxin family protein [Rhizobium sp. J15]PDT15890.1 hypothetical protein CO670_15455 [Rhizobium sp. J15]